MPYGKCIDDYLAEGGVLIGRKKDVMVYEEWRLPGHAPIARGNHVYIGKLEFLLRRVIGFGGVHPSVWRDMREHVAVPRMPVNCGQHRGGGPIRVAAIGVRVREGYKHAAGIERK